MSNFREEIDNFGEDGEMKEAALKECDVIRDCCTHPETVTEDSPLFKAKSKTGHSQCHEMDNSVLGNSQNDSMKNGKDVACGESIEGTMLHASSCINGLNEVVNEQHYSNCPPTQHELTNVHFNFDLLPHVVRLNVLSYLDIRELGRTACVSKQWNSSSYDPSLWRQLNLSGRRLVTDQVLHRIISISKNITVLDISECMVCSEQGLQKALEYCSSLQVLRTVRCPSMTDVCLVTVGQTCLSLRELDFSMCPITDRGLEKLCEGCNNIEEMKMDQCRFITSATLLHIANNCPKLRLLSVEQNIKIQDEGVTELVSKCRKLKRLQLNSCGISGSAVRSIAAYALNMTILDVRYCTTLNDDIVKELVCGCPNLVILNLSLCFNVTDTSTRHIVQHCTKLLSLYLVNCRITDEGLGILSVNQFGLERLDISWCQDVTDVGVKSLVRGCKTLRHLGLVRCDQVSNETITELSMCYPSIFLSTVMTEVNRMFKKAGIPDNLPPPVQ